MSYCGAYFPLGKTEAFMIFNKKSRKYEGSYCRGYHDDFMFNSKDEAEDANCFGIFKDKDTYEIHKVEVTVKRKELP